MSSAKNGNKVGIKEIAKRSGVSTTAVSLVLNDRPGVSEKTRRKIRNVIAEVGYKPSQTARSLGKRRKRTAQLEEIGFLAFGISAIRADSYYVSILSGVTSRAHELGLQLQSTSFEAEDVDLANIGMDHIDGLIVTGRPSLAFIERIRQANIPYVLISCSRARVPGDSVRPENTESSYQAVSHLAELGHRKIAFLGGEKSNPETWERYTGYLEAIDKYSIPFDPNLIVFSSFSPERSQEGFQELLERKVEFTAVFASNDYLAIGVYHLAHEHHIHIPNELSVVGFDDIETARFLRPQLTTIQTDQAGLGKVAINRLVQLMEHSAAPLTIRIQTNLIVRNSTSAPS